MNLTYLWGHFLDELLLNESESDTERHSLIDISIHFHWWIITTYWFSFDVPLKNVTSVLYTIIFWANNPHFTPLHCHLYTCYNSLIQSKYISYICISNILTFLFCFFSSFVPIKQCYEKVTTGLCLKCHLHLYFNKIHILFSLW